MTTGLLLNTYEKVRKVSDIIKSTEHSYKEHGINGPRKEL